MGKRRMGTFSVDAEIASILTPQRFVRVPKLLVDPGVTPPPAEPL